MWRSGPKKRVKQEMERGNSMIICATKKELSSPHDSARTNLLTFLNPKIIKSSAVKKPIVYNEKYKIFSYDKLLRKMLKLSFKK